MSDSLANALLAELARSLPATFDDDALRELASRLGPFLDAERSAEPSSGQLLTTAEAAERARVNVETIRRAIRAGDLPIAARIGRSVRLTALAIDGWLAETSRSEQAVRPARSRRNRVDRPREYSLSAAFKNGTGQGA
jgi:excisionase family DNA binding protein